MIFSFDTEIAQKYGDRAAYFLGYLQHNISANKANDHNQFDGRTWSYNSMAAFTKIYTWLNERQIRTVIDNLVDLGIILKCNARDDLKVSGINPKTNAYAFVNEAEWIKIKNENPSDEKVKRNKNSSDFKVAPSDFKVKQSDEKVRPNNNSLPLITIERESALTVEVQEEIQKMWIGTWGRNPKLPELEETFKLIKKLSFERVFTLMRESSLKNFKNFNNFLEAIDDNGNLKPLKDNKTIPQLLSYQEMMRGTEKYSAPQITEHMKKFITEKIGDKAYWKLKEAV